MRNPISPPLAPISCPYCGSTLSWSAGRWLAAYECNGCGQFTDFGKQLDQSSFQHRSAMERDFHERVILRGGLGKHMV